VAVAAGMSSATLAWVHRVAVFVHVAGVIVWLGAVAYHLLILFPALRASGIERPAYYAVVRAIKRRLRVVIGIAIVAIVVSGLVNAELRGLLNGTNGYAPLVRHLFYAKLVVVGVLVVTFLTALPLLQRVTVPKLRGRLFKAVHVAVLVLGLFAAAVGVILSR
jgi:uncharacterized membrane protein